MEEGGLCRRLASQFPSSRIIAVYNGVETEAVPNQESPFFPTWSQPGLREALVSGYNTYVHGGYNGPLVRTDSDEHPPAEFPRLVQHAKEINGLVIGDLRYDEDLMATESPDGLAQQIWLEMYGQATRGKAPVGNAHGLQVFASPSVCHEVLLAAWSILKAADTSALERIQWGFDGILILAAVAAGVPLEIVPIAGTSERNRSTAKIMDQYKKHSLVLRAAAQIYPDQLG
ncbi:MAG TPA: hypothetical protein VLE93_02905 [Candidatus Saccharimonadales bacterium]|nr:hypothetical protein [Candidatus Saccharimonadales bacterium]